MKGYYLMPHPPIMIPEIGRGEERKIDTTITSCKEVAKRISELDIETIIIISPHGLVFRDGIAIITETMLSGNFSKFGARNIKMNIKIDTELTNEIIKASSKNNIVTVSLDSDSVKYYDQQLELDHGAMVPLYYVNKEKYKIVHITYGMLSPTQLYHFGMILNESVEKLGKKVTLIASGDLSHRLTHDGPYPFSPYGATFDNKLIEILKNGNIKELFKMNNKLINEAGECGLRSLYILAGALDGYNAKGEVLSYEGPFGVGYGIVDFHFTKGESIFEELKNLRENIHQKKIEKNNIYTKLARKSLDYFFENHKPMPIDENGWSLLCKDTKGVFVSIKKDGDLRGCIGTISPTRKCIAEEIVINAISAATDDPRFDPMDREELLDCTISVDVLGKPEKATKEELDPINYGVIVTKGRKRGLLLPNLEGVDTVDYQLQIALQKANISPRDNYEIERFKVERYEEEDINE